MTEWQNRVVEEQDELENKIGKLSGFLGDPNDVPSEERVRMHTQLGLMEQYNRVLIDRIDAFA